MNEGVYTYIKKRKNISMIKNSFFQKSVFLKQEI